VIPTTPESEHVRFCHLRSDYFGTPHLVRANHRDILNQVMVTTIAVIALRGPHAAFDQRQQVLLAHRP